MKTPEEYLREANVGNFILFERNKVLVWFLEFVEEVQKDAYNQAIRDVMNSTEDGYISIITADKLKIK